MLARRRAADSLPVVGPRPTRPGARRDHARGRDRRDRGFARSRSGRRFARWETSGARLKSDARTAAAVRAANAFGRIELVPLEGRAPGTLGRVFADHCRAHARDPNRAQPNVISRRADLDPVRAAFSAGYRAGEREAALMDIDWKELWDVPLAEVRDRLRLSPDQIAGEGIREAA